MIFAGESAVDKFTDGCRLVNVIQNNYQWNIGCAGFPIDLIGQVGEIKLQILRREKEREGERATAMKLAT